MRVEIGTCEDVRSHRGTDSLLIEDGLRRKNYTEVDIKIRLPVGLPLLFAWLESRSENSESESTTRHCLIIICSGIPRRTPRGSWPCNGWLSSRTGLLGAAAPSGGRHSARPYFGRGTSGHRRSADAPDRLGCFHVPGSLTRCLCPRTTAGSNRHRRPGRQRLPRGVSEAVLEVEGPTPRPSDR